MPNRIIRDGILTSERIQSLVELGGWEAEVFYRRLHSVVDDYGRIEARPNVLRAALYPLALDMVSDDNVSRLLQLCVNARLVTVYQVGGKPYLEVVDFKQQVRAKRSKWPGPPCAAHAKHMRSTCAAYAHLDEGACADEGAGECAPPNPPRGAGQGVGAELLSDLDPEAEPAPSAVDFAMRLGLTRQQAELAPSVPPRDVLAHWVDVTRDKTVRSPGAVVAARARSGARPPPLTAKVLADAARKGWVRVINGVAVDGRRVGWNAEGVAIDGKVVARASEMELVEVE